MKLSGDVKESDKRLAVELSKNETDVDNEPLFPADRKAQCFVCLAHDWYQLDMEEEGNRLLLKAEKVCPGYFKEKIKEHTSENKDFAKLVQNITIELLFLFTEQIK